MDNFGYNGQNDPGDGAAEDAAIANVARRIMLEIKTTKLVLVKAVRNNGALAQAGFIDAQPLVNQVDGAGNPTPHGVIYNIPYLRTQGGVNAIILDPVVGDIGVCGFDTHDISTVKTTRAAANPASGRRFDYADAVYIGGVLNGVPEQFIRFSSDGIEVLSPTKVRLVAPTIEMVASDVITMTATHSITETAPQVNVTASTRITESTATFSLTATTGAGITSPLTTITGLATITGLTTMGGGFAASPRVGGGASTITGDLSVTSGNVSFSGALSVTGATTLAGVTAGGKNIGGLHTHTGVQTGSGTSGPPT